MTYKEALDTFKAKVNEEYERGLPGSNELHLKIMQALVKQIPEATDGRCPACGRELRCPIKPYTALSGRRISRSGDNFCPKCGQAVKWGGDYYDGGKTNQMQKDF